MTIGDMSEDNAGFYTTRKRCPECLVYWQHDVYHCCPHCGETCADGNEFLMADREVGQWIYSGRGKNSIKTWRPKP